MFHFSRYITNYIGTYCRRLRCIATVFIPLAQRRMRSSLKFGNVGEGIPGVGRRGRWVGFRVSSKKKRNICIFAVILTTPGFQYTPPMECLRPEDRYNIYVFTCDDEVTCPEALSGAIITPAERRYINCGLPVGWGTGPGVYVPHSGCRLRSSKHNEIGRIKWKRRNLNLLRI